MTRIAAISVDPVIGDLTGNVRRATQAIRAAIEAGAELIVLPELITSGYVFASREEAAGLAIAADDPRLDEWGTAARAGGAVVVAGFCERGEDGELYNSAVLIDGGRRAAVYRKSHLWDREKLVFRAGDDPPPVIETSAGRIGLLVCYDLEFPEMTRALALAGADVIAVPTNWPLVERPAGERPPEVIAAMAAARTNRAYIACADRAGSERGVPFTGGTCIVSCEGWVIAATATDGRAVADVDLGCARAKAIGDRNDVFTDRRPEIYGALPNPRTEVLDRA